MRLILKTIPDSRTVIVFGKPYRAGGGNNRASHHQRMGSVFWSCQHVIDVMVWAFRRRGGLAHFAVDAGPPLGPTRHGTTSGIAAPEEPVPITGARTPQKRFPPTSIQIDNSYVASMNALRWPDRAQVRTKADAANHLWAAIRHPAAVNRHDRAVDPGRCRRAEKTRHAGDIGRPCRSAPASCAPSTGRGRAAPAGSGLRPSPSAHTLAQCH